MPTPKKPLWRLVVDLKDGAESDFELKFGSSADAEKEARSIIERGFATQVRESDASNYKLVLHPVANIQSLRVKFAGLPDELKDHP